jgi:hypothetical protein
MTDWHAPIASFAKGNGYRFTAEFAFCRVEAPFGKSHVELWLSNMGPGTPRGTLAGALMDQGVTYCRAKAKLVVDFDIEVRRKTILDRLFLRGLKLDDTEFDARYVALGKEADIRRFLRSEVMAAFVRMWTKTEGLCVEDNEVALAGGQFSFEPKELAFIIETVGTIASSGSD